MRLLIVKLQDWIVGLAGDLFAIFVHRSCEGYPALGLVSVVLLFDEKRENIIAMMVKFWQIALRIQQKAFLRLKRHMQTRDSIKDMRVCAT